MINEFVSRIEEKLWPSGERRDVWMIADAARNEKIFGLLLECHLEYSCLYSGYVHPILETAAPYLILLEHQDRNTQRLLQSAWGNSWGIFLRCDSRITTLRQHLRKFLVVRDPPGNRLIFRYYDPRVLRVYLPTCLESELQTVFGPIECFWTEGTTKDELLEFRFHKGRVVRQALSMSTGAS